MKYTIGMFFVGFSVISPTAHSMAIINIEPETNVFVQPQEFHNDDLNKKTLTRKKQTAATLFGGLAQASAQLTQVLTTENKKEKQQAILNLINTAFNTAAQLAATTQNQLTQQASDSSVNTQQQPQQGTETNQQLATKLTDLSNILIHEIETPGTKEAQTQLPITLELLKNIQTDAERNLLISSYLSSPNTAKQFIDELFGTIQTYIQKELTLIFDAIKKETAQH